MLLIPDLPPMPERRLKELSVTAEQLLWLLKTQEPITISFSGLPKDARVVSGYYEATMRDFVMIIESESFPPLLTGQVPQRISVLSTRYYPEAIPQI